MFFLAFCVEQYKHEKSMDGGDVMRLFIDKGVAQYLTDHYDVLHTQGARWLVQEIDDFIEKKG